jgi:hypothetical protein
MLLIFRFRFKYFRYADNWNSYKRELAPYNIKGFFSAGYSVDYNEMEKHSEIAKNHKLLEKKQELMRGVKHKQVVLSLDDLKEHIVSIAKTGGGKSVAIANLIHRLAELGLGAFILDAKADQKFYFEIANIMKLHKRETDFFVLNYTNASKLPDTNTMQPTEGMHPSQVVEFLSEMGNEGKADSGGNHQHFVNRGKAMLLPIYAFSKLRDEFYGINFSIGDIEKNTDIKEMNITQCVAYGVLKDINDRLILKNSSLKKKADFTKGAKLVTFVDFSEVELLIEYVTLNPISRFEVEDELGIKYDLVRDMFYYVFYTMQLYIASVRSGWASELEVMCKFMYAHFKSEGKGFLPNDEAFVTTVMARQAYEDFKSGTNTEKITSEARLSKKSVNAIFNDFSLENQPSESLTQHSYAQQQFNYVFQIFNTFSHIFGVRKSEIKMQRIFENNQFLLTMIPPTLASSIINGLAKISLASIKQAEEKSLGGENLNLTAIQKNIYTDTTKPFVLYEIILDEYYAIADATGEVGLYTAQMRSLSMGIWISTQFFDGLKSGESGNREKGAILANTQKYFLEQDDNEAVKYLEEYLDKVAVQRRKSVADHRDIEMETDEIDIMDDFLFNPKNIQKFRNGFAGLAKKGKLHLVQNWYQKPIDGSSYLRRYRFMDNM